MVGEHSETGARVRRFYEELPFNFLTTKDSASLITAKNQIQAYADLDGVLSHSPGATVLDIGCGAGWFVNSCAFYYRLHTTGLDLTEKAIARAAETSTELGIDELTHFVRGDLFELELDESFDVVSSIGVLHHTFSVPKALERAANYVAPGGALHIGLYHSYGRAPFLELFEPYRAAALAGTLSEADSEEALSLYAELHPSADDEFLRSWFRDQVLHPHETQHSLEEVHALLSALGFEIFSTSINRFEPFEHIENLFELERGYEELSRQRNHIERRYFPGFFTVLARQS